MLKNKNFTEKKTQEKYINPYPILNCNNIKDIIINKNFSQESFIKNSFIYKENDGNSSFTEKDEITLTEYKFTQCHLSVEEISQYILRNAR